jgi:ribosomal protein S18 acetylase RimI-like enzyme
VILTARRFAPGLEADFDALHARGHSPDGAPGPWCHCVAWWVPTWEGWSDRSAADNRSLRAALCARGEYDGYLGYLAGAPGAVAWCQAGPRDRLVKLRSQLGLERDPHGQTWALSCFFVAPAFRRRGVAERLLHLVLADLPRRGARRVEAYPRLVAEGDDELWNGPQALFARAGFQVERRAEPRVVMTLALG